MTVLLSLFIGAIAVGYASVSQVPAWSPDVGFAHTAPVVVDAMLALALDDEAPNPQFGLSRFGAPPLQGWQQRWS